MAYHDVRTLAAAAGREAAPALSPDAVRALGDASVDVLREREERTDVPLSDLYATVTADHARTVNHPGNAIFLPSARASWPRSGSTAAWSIQDARC